MASRWQSVATWRPMISTVAIYALGEIVARHLLQNRPTADLPEDVGLNADLLQEENIGSYHFYVKYMPGSILSTLGKAIRDNEWQFWLELTYPGWSLGRVHQEITMYSGPKADKLRDVLEDEELENEILGRLIAKGKAQLPSPWLNTVAKWVLDNCLAVTVFGLVDALMSSIWAADPSVLFSFLTVHMWVRPLLHFFSTKPLVSFVSFVVIPVEHRITFLAGVDTVTSVFFSVLLNGAAAWVMSQEWAVELMKNASAAAENLGNATVEWNGVKLVEDGKVLQNVSELAGPLKNGTVSWEDVRTLREEL